MSYGSIWKPETEKQQTYLQLARVDSLSMHILKTALWNTVNVCIRKLRRYTIRVHWSSHENVRLQSDSTLSILCWACSPVNLQERQNKNIIWQTLILLSIIFPALLFKHVNKFLTRKNNFPKFILLSVWDAKLSLRRARTVMIVKQNWIALFKWKPSFATNIL